MRRALDQSSFRAFPGVHPDIPKTTITLPPLPPPYIGPHSKRIVKRARSRARLRRANIRGTQRRGKRPGMSPRRRASFRRGEWIDVLRARLRGKRRSRSLLDSSGLYRQRKSTWSEQRGPPNPREGGRPRAMNHPDLIPERIIHR